MNNQKARLMSYKSLEQTQLWLMLLPGVILYAIFNFFPILGLSYMSLTSWTGIGPVEFVGLENFRMILLEDHYRSGFLQALRQNIQFFVVIIGSLLGIGTLIALLLSFKVYGRKYYQVLFFLPYPLAGAAVAYMLKLIFENTGPVNSTLLSMGIIDGPVNFLGSEDLTLLMFSGFYSWHRMGFAILLVLSAILAVRVDLVEAAFLDGASRWQALRHIVMPVLAPAFVVIFIIILVDTFNNADLTLLIAGPQAGPNFSTDVLGSYLYRSAFGAGPTSQVLGYGVASVVGILTALVILPAAMLGALRNIKDK